MEPQHAAWIAAGSPTPGPGCKGVCARCGERGQVHRGGVPGDAAGFDGWHHPGLDELCAPCTWGRASPELRQGSWLIHHPPSLHELGRRELAEHLRTGLDQRTALAVALRPRRKHSMPAARWGHVAVDDVPVPWGPVEVARFELVLMLRAAGFGPRHLMARSPDFTTLSKISPDRWHQVQDAWLRLRPWREPPTPWMTLALHATDRRA